MPVSDPQPGLDEPSVPEDPALPTDFWESPLAPDVVAPGGDGDLDPAAAEPAEPSDPGPADVAGSWFWSDATPEVPTPDDGDVVIGPDWWGGGDELEVALPDDLLLTPATVDEPEPLPSAILPGPAERPDPVPEEAGDDLFFAPTWADAGEEPATDLPDDMILAPAAVEEPEPVTLAVLAGFHADPSSDEAGQDLFFAPTWADGGEEPGSALTDDLTLAPAPVDEPEPVTLAVLPGPPAQVDPGSGRWDRLRVPGGGTRAKAAAVGLVLGASVLVGILSRSDTPPTDLVQSGPTAVQPAPPRSVATTQVPSLQASPVDIAAPATDAPAPAADAGAGPVRTGAGSNPPPAAGAPARAAGASPASPAGGPRPAGGSSSGPGPAPAPAAAAASPAPAAPNPPARQEEPEEPADSRRARRTTLPPVTQPPAQPETTVAPPDEGPLPCFEQIEHGRLACPP